MPTKTAVPPGLRHLPPTLLSIVKAQCGGDWRRCVLDPDGSITVLNNVELAQSRSAGAKSVGPKKSAAKQTPVKRTAPVDIDEPPVAKTPRKAPVKRAAPVKAAPVAVPAEAEPAAPAPPREDLTPMRDPGAMAPETVERVYEQKIPQRSETVVPATTMPKHLQDPQVLPPRRPVGPKDEQEGKGWTRGVAPSPIQAPVTIRDRLSDSERRAAQAMRKPVKKTDKPIPPAFDVRDAWEKLDVDRVASSMLAACRAGLPEELPLDMHAEVLALDGINFELVVSSVRNPNYVEIAGLETKEKGYPVMRFFRGDITTVVGLREAKLPIVIATYAWSTLDHDIHRTGTSKGSTGGSGGGGARKQTGLPGTPRALVKRLRSLGAAVEDDELGDTPVTVLFQGQDLGKIPRKGGRDICETAYQRTIRKMEAIIRRNT